MRHLRFHIYLLLMAAMLAACASGTNLLGSTSLAPQTFSERLAAGYSLNAAVRQSATTLLQAKSISADDADSVLKTTDASRAALDVARSLSKTDLTSAEAKLAATHTVLVALQSYLSTRGK